MAILEQFDSGNRVKGPELVYWRHIWIGPQPHRGAFYLFIGATSSTISWMDASKWVPRIPLRAREVCIWAYGRSRSQSLYSLIWDFLLSLIYGPQQHGLMFGSSYLNILIWVLNWVLDINTRFKVFASYNILQYLCDFIHVLIFVTVSKCQKVLN